MPNSFTRHQVLKEIWSRWCQKTRPISLPVFPPFWWLPTLHAKQSRFWCEDTNACTSLLKGLPWPCGISGPRMYVLSETSSETITNFANCHSVADMFHLVTVLCGSLQCAFSLIISNHLLSHYITSIYVTMWYDVDHVSSFCPRLCAKDGGSDAIVVRGHGSDKWAHFKSKRNAAAVMSSPSPSPAQGNFLDRFWNLLVVSTGVKRRNFPDFARWLEVPNFPKAQQAPAAGLSPSEHRQPPCDVNSSSWFRGEMKLKKILDPEMEMIEVCM